MNFTIRYTYIHFKRSMTNDYLPKIDDQKLQVLIDKDKQLSNS